MANWAKNFPAQLLSIEKHPQLAARENVPHLLFRQKMMVSLRVMMTLFHLKLMPSVGKIRMLQTPYLVSATETRRPPRR